MLLDRVSEIFFLVFMPLTPEQQQIVESLVESANKVAGKLCPGDDEARSVAYLALCEVVKTWEDDKGMTPKTWCLNHARWAVQKYKRNKNAELDLRKQRVQRRKVIPSANLDCNPGKCDDIELFEINDLLTVLPLSYRDIFRQVVLEEVTVKDISKARGCSTSRVYAILKRCKERLRREIDGDYRSHTSRRLRSRLRPS